MDDISRDPDTPQPSRSGAARGPGCWAEDGDQAPEQSGGSRPAAEHEVHPRFEGASGASLSGGDDWSSPQAEAATEGRLGPDVWDRTPDGDQLPGDRLLGDQLPGDRLLGDQLPGDRVLGLENAQVGPEAVADGEAVSELDPDEPQEDASDDVSSDVSDEAPEAPVNRLPQLPGDEQVPGAHPADSPADSPAESPVEHPVEQSPEEPIESDGVVPEAATDGDSDAGAPAIPAEVQPAKAKKAKAVESQDLPEVPELSDPAEVAPLLLPLLLTARDGTSMIRLAQACNTTPNTVKEALPLLQQRLSQAGLPVEVVRAGEAAKLMAGPDVFPYLQRLRGVKQADKLSPAALETLAVVAYRQPVIRGEIESIRGVKCGPVLRMLLDHKLVAVTGRADVPGRPLQYGTTQHFLERFGLESLKDLPSLREFRQLG